jgi:PTS system galactitol-specific IIB component
VREVRLLVACGSGIATSTLVAERVQEILKERGINVSVKRCSLQEVPGFQGDADAILTTTRYTGQLEKPVINAVSLITGVGEDKTINELLNALQGTSTEAM